MLSAQLGNTLIRRSQMTRQLFVGTNVHGRIEQ
jgi:hypothetical protein